MTSLTDVSIASAAFKANPYPFYARLRAEAPVCCVIPPDTQTGIWHSVWECITV